MEDIEKMSYQAGVEIREKFLIGHKSTNLLKSVS